MHASSLVRVMFSKGIELGETMYKVLIAEDEEMIRKGIIYAFDWAEVDCIVVGEVDNGQEGVAKIRELQPDIVITDVNMPILDGLNMLQQTIEEVLYAAVVISGYDEFALAQRALRLGVSEYLLKPVEFDNLHLAIQRAKQQVEQRKLYAQAMAKGEQPDALDLLADAKLGVVASKRVKAMLEYLHSHYAEKISINDLVEPLQTSASYLNQKFKEETCYTFNEYLNRYRIMQAIQMIRQGDEKIYTIAEEAGFRDYKYFISVFRKYVNLSPKRFAEKYGS